MKCPYCNLDARLTKFGSYSCNNDKHRFVLTSEKYTFLLVDHDQIGYSHKGYYFVSIRKSGNYYLTIEPYDVKDSYTCLQRYKKLMLFI